jgi:transcriptional regulator with XRE-family HTH domain
METSGGAKSPGGTRVAANVAALRQTRGLSLRGLSAQLSELGHRMLPSGIMKLEAGERRVTVDDLLAFAVALDVPPNRLLLGGKADDEPVALTATYSLPRIEAWRWATRIAGDADEIELSSLERYEDTLSELGVGRAAVAALEAGVPADVLVGYVYLAPTMRRMQRAAHRADEGDDGGQHPAAS